MNAQTAHTPGNWVTNGFVVSVRLGNSQRIICELSTSAPSRGKAYLLDSHHAELMANGRLIAAAPELLAALERLQRNFNLLLVGKPVRDVAETDAEVKAALAKVGAA